MDIRTRVTAVLTAGILAAAPIIAFALPNYTLNGNYTVTGTLQVNTLSPNQCVATNASRVLVSSGAACGGGGGGAVSSVTAGPTGNITVAPNTGAVIVDMLENPSFTGQITDSFNGGDNAAFFNLVGHTPLEWQAQGGSDASDRIVLSSTGTHPVAGVQNNVFGIFDVDAPSAILADNGTTLGLLDLNDAHLTPGQCVQAGTNGQLTSTGSACGTGTGTVTAVTATGPITSSGGTTPNIACVTCLTTSTGVTSVTAGPSGNLTFAPTTGAVVGDIIGSPTFSGTVTANTMVSPLFDTLAVGVGSLTQALRLGSTVSGGYSNLLACPASGCGALTAGVSGTAFAITTSTQPPLLALDTSADLGVNGYLAAGSLSASVGDCLEASTNGQIISTGAACGPSGGFPIPQTLHGNQSITAVAAACTPGTPIVFAHTFSAVPDIIMSTSAVVGDTAAPETGTITTTGFTPELCSIASAIAATVYWQAVN
jgi:hypothetical protein